MKRGHSGHTLAALAILAAFAVGMMACLVAGAGSYRRLNARSQASFDRRTASAYFSSQVRRGEEIGLEAFGDGQALCLYQQGYVTRIYCHDGWLMELFTAASDRFSPEDGERVLPMKELWLDSAPALLTIRFTDDQGTQTLVFQRDRYEK